MSQIKQSNQNIFSRPAPLELEGGDGAEELGFGSDDGIAGAIAQGGTYTDIAGTMIRDVLAQATNDDLARVKAPGQTRLVSTTDAKRTAPQRDLFEESLRTLNYSEEQKQRMRDLRREIEASPVARSFKLPVLPKTKLEGTELEQATQAVNQMEQRQEALTKKGQLFRTSPEAVALFDKAAGFGDNFYGRINRNTHRIQGAVAGLAHLTELRFWNREHNDWMGTDEGQAYQEELKQNQEAINKAKENGEILELEHSINGIPKHLLAIIAQNKGLDLSKPEGLREALRLGDVAMNTSQGQILDEMFMLYEIIKMSEEMLAFWNAQMQADIKAIADSKKLAASVA